MMRFQHDLFTLSSSESEDFNKNPHHIFHAVHLIIMKQNLVAGNMGNRVIDICPRFRDWSRFHIGLLGLSNLFLS
jgi:hypothetical protein